MDGNGLETERVGPLGNYVSFIESGVWEQRQTPGCIRKNLVCTSRELGLYQGSEDQQVLTVLGKTKIHTRNCILFDSALNNKYNLNNVNIK